MYSTLNYFLHIVGVKKGTGLKLIIYVKPLVFALPNVEESAIVELVGYDAPADVLPIELSLKEQLDLQRALGAHTQSEGLGLKGLMFPDLCPMSLMPRASLEEFFRDSKKVWIRRFTENSDGSYDLTVSLRTSAEEVRLHKWRKAFERRFGQFISKWWHIYPTATIKIDEEQLHKLMYAAGGISPTDLEGSYFLLPQSRIFLNPIEAIHSILD